MAGRQLARPPTVGGRSRRAQPRRERSLCLGVDPCQRYDGRVFLHALPLRRRFIPSLVVLALLALAPRATASLDVSATLDEIYHEHNIQRELPITAPTDFPVPSSFGIPSAFGWLVLVGTAMGAAALALWLMGVDRRTVAARRRKRRTRQNPHNAPDTGSRIPGDWLEKADNLARRGRFAEAIHLLLLGVLGTLRLADSRSSEAKTAREIARTHVGPHPERLRALVQVSELVHFGGRPATQRQFEDCRRDALEIDRTASPAPA